MNEQVESLRAELAAARSGVQGYASVVSSPSPAAPATPARGQHAHGGPGMLIAELEAVSERLRAELGEAKEENVSLQAQLARALADSTAAQEMQAALEVEVSSLQQALEQQQEAFEGLLRDAQSRWVAVAWREHDARASQWLMHVNAVCILCPLCAERALLKHRQSHLLCTVFRQLPC